MFDGLVRGAVLTQADGIVREHEDLALAHERGHANGVSRVVGEDEKGAGEGDVAAMQRDAVGDRHHAELAHAVVKVVSPFFRRDGVGAGPVGEVGTGEIGRAAQQLRQDLGIGGDGVLACLARGDVFAPGDGGADHLVGQFRPAQGQQPGDAALEFVGEFRIDPAIGFEALEPGGLALAAGCASIPLGVDLVGDLEGAVGPADRLARGGDLGLTQGGAVDVARALLVGGARTDHGAADDEAGALGLGLGERDGSIDRAHVVPVDRLDHVPAVGTEARGGILGEPALHLAVDRDSVGIVEDDELAQFPGAGQ